MFQDVSLAHPFAIKRAQECERLLAAILKTRDADGTWNDMLSAHCGSCPAAMVVLALSGDQAPLPPCLPEAVRSKP
jgi:hypothetical protein